MIELDQRFEAASSRLRAALEHGDIPEPHTARPRHSLVPLAAAAALIGVVIGGVALFTRGGTDTITPADAPTITTSSAQTTPASSDAAPTGDAVRENDTSTANAADTTEPDTGELGQEMQRLTSSRANEITAPAASLSQAFNVDGSLALLYRTGGDAAEHVVLDTALANSWNEIATLDLSAATDIEDFFWHPSEPDTLLIIAADRPELVEIDARTGSTAVTHRFDECDRIGPGGTSGSYNSGSALLAVVCERDDEMTWTAFDIASGTVVASAAALSNDAPIAMASGRGFVHLTDTQVTVLDTTLQPTGVTINVDVSSWTMATADGQDVLVATVFDGDVVGTVVVYDLATGNRRVIVGPDTGWQYPPTGTRLSRAVGSIVVVSTSPQLGSDAPDELDDVVVLVDVATGAVTPIASHEMADGDRFGNWSTPYTALHPDGETVIFSSDRGGDRIDTFRQPT